MRDQRIIATCGCVCEVSASYNWADESIEDVEVNILEPCDYHRPTQRAVDVARRCPACHAMLEDHSVYCDNCGTDTPRN